MENNMTEIGTVQQNIAALIRRSAVDLDFRKLCLLDGKKAYWSLTGKEWDFKEELCFVEESDEIPANKTVVVLPGFLAPTWLG